MGKFTDRVSKEKEQQEARTLYDAWSEFKTFLKDRLTAVRKEFPRGASNNNSEYIIHGVPQIIIPSAVAFINHRTKCSGGCESFINCTDDTFFKRMGALRNGASAEGIITGDKRNKADKIFNGFMEEITLGREKYKKQKTPPMAISL